MADKRYLVYRLYTKKEREDPNQRTVLYGWTHSKSVLKAFLSQRDEKKYGYIRIEEEDIGKYFDENVDDTDIMIDRIKLKSAKTGEEVVFFSTMNEVRQAEIDIQKYFRKLASFESIEGNDADIYVKMIIHLDKFFASALFFLGYRPQDIDIMFPSADEHDDFSGYSADEQSINFAYNSISQYPREEYKSIDHPLGLDTMNAVSSKILYSIESFVRVLVNEL
ncbi:MAG: hypothetical protein NC489_24355 [Ruminococcus flavefaciens]|nr:hypothetical protein [Ruminococcus flavefaciens]